MSDTSAAEAPSAPGTAVAPYMVRVLSKRADQLNPFLPKGMSLEAVAQIVQMMAVKQPELLACTPSSLLMGITRGLRAGLELGETWHLLTFKNSEMTAQAGRPIYECTGTADYKGLAQLMIASGAVRYVDPQVVREGDAYEETLGLEKTLVHRHGATRGKIVRAYVILTLPFGLKDFLSMSIEEIDAIRLRHSKQWKKGECPEWYAKKTVIRQIAKLLPKSPRLKAVFGAIEQDEQAEVMEGVPEDVPAAEFEEVLDVSHMVEEEPAND